MAWLSNWLYRKTITIPASSIDEDMTYFPLTVYLDKSNFIFSNAEIDGKDIRFTSTDSNNTPLKFERKEHDGSFKNDNYYMSFDGVDDAINLGTETTLYYGEVGRKLEFNFRINCEDIVASDSEPNYIIARNSTTAGGSNFEIGLHIGGNTEGVGNVVGLVGKVEGTVSTTELRTPGFHDLKVLFEDTTMSVYVDGTYKGAIESLQANNKFTSQPLRIGACSYTGGSTLYGEGQFKISYFSALQEDVLKIELGFDEGTGTSVGSSTSTNDGTTVGTPTWTGINSIAVYNVLIPAVSSSVDTSIYMWYGNSSAYNASIEAWQDQTGKALTYNGNVKIVRNSATDHYASFDGTGDYFTIPDSAAWSYSNGDFCIEINAKPETPIDANGVLLANCGSAGINSTMTVRIVLHPTGTSLGIFSGSTEYNVTYDASLGDEIRKYAYVREGNYLKIYVNGALVKTTNMGSAVTANESSEPLTIGRNGTYNGWHYKGIVGGIRITKGRARYTGTYTPPTSFEIDGTDVVLCTNFDTIYDNHYVMVHHLDNTLSDASGNGNKATVVGSIPTTITTLGTQRDFPGTSGNYMTVAQSTMLDMSSFTIQSLVNFDTLSSAYHYLFSRNNGTNAEGYYALSTNYDGTVGRTEIIISSSYRTADTNATLSTGTNLVLTGVYEQGVSLRTHINGIQDGTPYTGNYTLGTLSSTAYIGAQGNANWTDGKIGELRLSNITRSTSWIKAEALALKNNLITMSVANIKSQTLTAVQHTTHIDLSWT